MENQSLAEKLVHWRRNFHQYPETGFLEMRTASIVASLLDQWGFSLQLGKEVMVEEACMGKPSKEETIAHYNWAKENGAHLDYLPHFKDGLTGIVATYDTGKVGPTVGIRVDMDALPIHEAEDEAHVPLKEGFRSRLPGRMHACGHDAHTAIGLGLANKIAEESDQLSGKIKLIFQPAEEGTRGAKSMAEAGVVKDVDHLIAIHIGTGIPHKHVLTSQNGFLATSKLDITFKGVASHAGGQPEDGRNALLAAASAALNINAIPRHSSGITRVNVGEMHAGSGRNIIPSHATLSVETRGETSEINDFVRGQVESIVEGAAKMYENDYEMKVVGEARGSKGSLELAKVVERSAKEHPFFEHVQLEANGSAGSEDATFFMEDVQKNGGLATYCIFGTELAAGHHNERFDINEETLLPAVEVLFDTILRLGEK